MAFDLIEKLFGAVIERKVQERLPAAGAKEDPREWRRLSGNSNRELPVATWQRQVEVCYWLWKTNPLAGWIIDILKSFTLGKGFTFTAGSDELQQLLEDFWYDPVNRMDLKLGQKALELSLYGLQCWPVFVAEQTGRVRLGMIDPANVAQVFSDPENAEILIGVEVQSLEGGSTRRLKTILIGETETVVSEAARRKRDTFTDGECFLFAINRVSNDPYGTSDLFAVSDWLDEFEDFVFKFATKAKKQNAYLWDVEMAGADEKTCQAFAESYGNVKDGALRVHNEKVKWQALAPNLQALEIKESASVFRNHILGSKSIPPHWYGGLDDVNRAAAAEGNEPIKAFIDDRQNLWKFIVETLFTFVVQKALEARYLRVAEDDAFDFAVQKPKTIERDITKVSTGVRDVVTALVAAENSNWITRKRAIEIFAHVIALVGYELDPETTFEELEEEAEKKGYEDYTDPGRLPTEQELVAMMKKGGSPGGSKRTPDEKVQAARRRARSAVRSA